MIAGSKLEPCDLLFIVKGSGNAITAVTNGWHSRAIDHVAMVDSAGPEPTVCDATPRYGVYRRKLSEFLNAARADSAISEIIVGRVRVPFDADTVRARLQLLQGLPYDSLFLPDSRAIYCSELIQKVFVDKKGREVFTTIPMNFLDSQGRVPEQFARFYAQHGMAVPQGERGTNPGQLSRSHKVSIKGIIYRR